ncbi:MAG TPA: hypothetical protein VH637_11495 [Streptosporangiaceae bacterium]|jgi:hypothetical protein
MRKWLTAVTRLSGDQAGGAGPTPSSRRDFLRRAGMTGALAAGLAGGAELLGLSAASASAHQRSRKAGAQASCLLFMTCRQSPGACPGGPCHPSGHCCYTCTGCGTVRVSCRNTCSPSFSLCCT